MNGIVIEKTGRKTAAARGDAPASLYLSKHDAAPPSLFAALRILLRHLSKKRRKRLFPLLITMLAGAVAELVTIGALLPFLAVVADPNSHVLAYIDPFTSILDLVGRMQSIYALTALFAIVGWIVATMRSELSRGLLSAPSGFIHELARPCDVQARTA